MERTVVQKFIYPNLQKPTPSLIFHDQFGPSLPLGANTVAASDEVRVLGITISSDLSLDKHVANISAACFYRLRELRRVRRSLDTESAATLVHLSLIHI